MFVMDIFNGEVVHAVRGERSRYEPVDRISRVVSSSDPLEIIGEVKPEEVYVADLNRLTGSGDNLDLIEEISHKTGTMADIGISDLSDLELLTGSVKPVLGTETSSVKLIEDAARSRRIILSIDMKSRKTLTKDPSMMIEPLDLLAKLNDIDLEAVILLDLHRVGTSSGLDTGFLEESRAVSRHTLILGGGVKGVEDIKALEDLGFSGVLVATAVHNGKIPLSMLQR